MAIEYISITPDMQSNVADVERDAYGLRSGLYDEKYELQTLLGQPSADRYSFLVYDGSYQSYCIASLRQYDMKHLFQPQTLYINDFAVRVAAQGLHYGLTMAQEMLRRAKDDNIERIAFHARASTSYGAINTSKHTNAFLNYYGYTMNESGGTDIYSPEGRLEESFHLITLDKMAVHHL